MAKISSMQIRQSSGDKRPAAPSKVQEASSPAKASGKPVKTVSEEKGGKKGKESYQPPEIENVTFH